MSKSVTDYGKEMFHVIDSTIKGHVCMYDNEAGLLAKAVLMAGHGDHLEIGSMWGGSAILTAIVKRQYRKTGNVVCVDPFRDGDCSPGFPGGHPDESIFWQNADRMGVKAMLELHTCYSSPWPFPPERRFASVFIDGDHAGEWPMTDWTNASKVTDVIIMHDLYPHERGVMDTVATIKNDPAWKMQEQAGSLAVFVRVK